MSETHVHAAVPARAPKKPNSAFTTPELFHAVDQLRVSLWEQTHDQTVTARQYLLLRTIHELGPCSQTKIVAAAGIDRSMVAEVLFRLAKAGLVSRRRNRDDRRAFDVDLTTAGEAARQNALVTDAVVEAAILKRLTATERRILRSLLLRVLSPETL